MLPGMDEQQAKQVLAAARDSARMNHWDEVEHQLREVHAQQVLTGADQGDAAYLLGLAAMGSGDWDGATDLLVEASSSAGTEYRTEALQRLKEIQHHNAATTAEADQDVDQAESSSVLAAADEAYGHNDFDGAYGHYWAVYNGHADNKVRARAALGIARSRSHLPDLTEAKQYAQYVTGLGFADLTDEANSLLSWIGEQEAAVAAAADGTTIDEFTKADEAARSAFFNSDYARAKAELTSMLNSTQIGAVERGKAALNLGMAEMMLREYDAAKLNFEIAATHGAANVVERAHYFQAMLDRHDAAETLVAEYQD